MKLNFHQAWHFHYIAKIKQPFKLWLKTKKQGKVKVYGEWEDNGMYDVPEADDNEEFQKWIEEFSIELLDRTMKENKDVLERLKEAESER